MVMARLTLGLLIVFLLMTGCNSVAEPSDGKTAVTIYEFTGIIEEIFEDQAIVLTSFGGNDSVGRVVVDLSVNPDDLFIVGEKIKVEFDGIVKESNPGQIHTIAVEHVEKDQ